MSMLIDAYRYGAGPPPGGSLFDEYSADGPSNWWRNGEPNTAGGMVDEVAANGTWVGAVSLGNAPIYPGAGAPTCVTGFSNTKLGSSVAFPASLAEMSLQTVQRFNTVSGIQPIGVQRDGNGSGGQRFYQFRSNNTDIQFVRIIGSVGVYQVSGVLSAGVSYLIACELDIAGNCTIYLNGVPQSGSWISGSAAAADYGGAGDDYQIGYFDGGGVSLDGYTCENAVFDYCPGATRQAAYATAAGL